MAPYRKSLSALLIGLAFSPAALPLGFGDLQLQSQLNQPLQAEIPILGVPAYASDAIRIRLGRREDFAALGYDYVPEIDDIRAEVQKRDNRLVLQLTSRNALREPLVNIVLVAEEGNTRYLRDYALLLDLPGTPIDRGSAIATTAAPSAPAVSAPEGSSTDVTAPAQARTDLTGRSESPVRANTRAHAPSITDETVYGPTRPGESLSTISHRLGKARGEEWHAFGVALYHANPEAFIAGDPNRLKAAMPLHLPTPSDVQRYHRSDWLALFDADQTTISERRIAAQTISPQATAARSAQPAAASVDPVNLQQLQSENAQLKAELQSASGRMQALETQLARLDARYAELMEQQVAALQAASSASVPATTTAPTAAAESVATLSPPTESATTDTGVSEPAANSPTSAPVTVQIRDTLAEANQSAAASGAAVAKLADTRESELSQNELSQNGPPQNESSQNEQSQGEKLRSVIWSLLTVVGLTLGGVLFWQWSERRQVLQALRNRPRATRTPRPVLPLAEADEPAASTVDTSSPDKRILKLKQVQAALETYTTYQRYDRALELLEQEVHSAGDDLLLRRQLQRLQKHVRHEQMEWQQTQKDELSHQFDRATVTHVDKPKGRDESKKTSG